MHVTRLRTLFTCLSLALLTTSVAHAATVGWEGETWDDNYNSPQTSLTVNGSNHLEVTPNTPGQWAAAHFDTSLAFRAAATPWIEFSFLDTGNAVRKGIWVEDETTSPLGSAGGWLQFEIPASGPNYRVLYNDYDADLGDNASLDFSTSVSVDTGVARSVGERTFKIGSRADGTVDFWIDGSLVTSLTSAQFNPNFFGDIYLAARGETAEYTNFATGSNYVVPEPSSVILAAIAGLGLLAVRRRRKI